MFVFTVTNSGGPHDVTRRRQDSTRKDTDLNSLYFGQSNLATAMEILVNNGHTNAHEAGNADVPDTCEVEDRLCENGSLGNNQSALVADTGNMVDSSGMDLEDVSMKVNTKKRAFDEDSKDLHSPSKKLTMRSSSDVLIAEVDSAAISSPLTEAINIDTTREEPGVR